MDCPVKLRSGVPTDADMRKINAVASMTCSICDEETCSHVKGSVYDGKLCFKNLNSPVDAYEWAFVV